MKRSYHLLAKYLEQKFKVDAHYFLKGGFWLVTAQTTTIATSLLATVFMTNLLSPQEFGVYRYIIGLGLMFGVFSLTGIGQAITQATAKGLSSFYYLSVRPTLSFSLVISLLSLFAAVYYHIMGNQTLALGCLIVGFLQPGTQLFGCTIAYLQGERRFKEANHVQTAKSFFVSGSTIAALYISHNILWLLAVYFSSQAVASVYTYFLFAPKKLPSQNELESAKPFLSFAKHASFRNLIDGISTKADSILVFQQLGAAELAVYTIATLIPDQIRSSFKNLLNLLIPKFTQHESLKTLRFIIPKRSVQFLMILIITTTVFILLIPFVYDLLFPKYSSATLYTQLLALSFPASLYLIPFGALQSQRKEKRLYIYHLVVGTVQIVSLLVFIPFFGLMGAIVAKIITQYCRLLVSYWALYKE